MTMVFAVEEINRNSSLLPGVKLGYRITDSCDHVHTSLQALFSLVSHSEAVTSEVKQMKEIENRFKMQKGRATTDERLKSVEKTRKKRMLDTQKYRGTEISESVLPCLEKGECIKGNVTKETMYRSIQSETVHSCLADSPVPAVIGLASSSPTRAVAHTLGPFNLPLVRN